MKRRTRLVVLLLIAASLTLTGMLYDDWGYRNLTVTESANYDLDPPETYILRRQKRWQSFPGAEHVDIQLTHEEYVLLLLKSEFEITPTYKMDTEGGGAITQIYTFKDCR